jgi:hypothetical protein
MAIEACDDENDHHQLITANHSKQVGSCLGEAARLNTNATARVVSSVCSCKLRKRFAMENIGDAWLAIAITLVG